jgi:DNA-binding transcriptional regulator LsrR (DeoR family)
VREIQMSCDIAVFSVGSTSADVPSRVYAGGYLRPEDRRQLQADGAIGDIATYFFRADGTAAGIRLNDRASGLPLDRLSEIPVRFCVAAGDGKTEALLGALTGGYVTHLVADEALINRVYQLHTSQQQAGELEAGPDADTDTDTDTEPEAGG